MFQECSDLKDRYKAAKNAGFDAVECGNPYVESINELVRAKEDADVQQILINSFVGDTFIFLGDTKGLTAVPMQEEDFRQSLELSIKYAEALKCKRIHTPCGAMSKEEAQIPEVKQRWESTYIRNLRYAAERLKQVGIMLLIEPVTTIPNCFLTRTDQAIDIIKKVDHHNIKLLLDLFHAQRGHGNLTQTLTDYMPYIGHIQISQVPSRHEPDSDGEINYPFIFHTIAKLGYKGWIGCEYTPRGKTEDGLRWLAPYRV
ncbi:predicted protein [Nematostella vectensis]|uniref:Putative hydroxypyruvate isomerase n=1 Tax=Nematostella vectensis TaxID=45351 RepID=A7RNR7_NEMVE|nr:predicted protein [Nematostella vectensis]|eukprot:XP_001639041.1 predicted protein [Nematostella vectensis]